MKRNHHSNPVYFTIKKRKLVRISMNLPAVYSKKKKEKTA
ncbi:hypothetical protein RV07_GL001873 [Enterococcus malodoratus]|nr:hypothetical protein RV07_GL001873 [Enterococcus malodoratus]